jgi:type IV secretory pathway ATPase VirB11/archaellum biosynthesis ATPase
MTPIDYNSVSELDWARLAAYIDGEGCIVICNNNGTGKKAQGHADMTLLQ